LIPHALEPAFEQTEVDHHIMTLKYLLLCIAAIFASFLLEKGFRIWSDRRKRSGLDKKPAKAVDEQCLHSEDSSEEGKEGEKNEHHHHHGHGHGHGHGLGHVHHVQAFGWINLVSDAIHNFFDGVAIGVAFQTSPSVGISTTLAVFFHEIPQELGDYALLIRAGFTRKQALLFNLFCGSTAIVGTFIGCGIGSLAYAEPWILSFVAGMFLYVGLADIIPELNHTADLKTTAFQIGGMCAGFIITAGLVLAELALEANRGC
jgi:zinc transporter ZupT